MKPISPPLQVALGLGLVLGGLAYDVMFAGIPYQDPTPEMSASYSFHSRIASWVRWAGLGLLCVGCMAVVARRFARRRRRQAER